MDTPLIRTPVKLNKSCSTDEFGLTGDTVYIEKYYMSNRLTGLFVKLPKKPTR